MLKIPIVDDTGASAWPELFPITRIDALRNAVGARQFSGQMMLQYVAPDNTRLDPGDLRLYDAKFDIYTAKIADTVITGVSVYWDPSGGGPRADGSVCVLVYRDDKNRHIFIHDVVYLTVPDGTTHPLGYQCEKVIDFMLQHNVYRISVETNGIGNALPEIIRDVAMRREVNISVLRVVNNKNKESRILDAIEPVLTTGRLHANIRVQSTPLISEMIGWSPHGAGHDDGLDAIAGAICATPVPVRAQNRVIQTYNANINFKP